MNRLKQMLVLLIGITGFHEAHSQRFEAPITTIKTNILGATSGSINLAGEFTLRRQRTFDDLILSLNLPVSYNPFTFGESKRMKHIAFQPEYRIRKQTSLGSGFFGINAHYAYYNVGGVSLPFKLAPSLREQRFQGQLYGMGVTGGYYFKIGENIGFETTLGAGYAYLNYDVYRCETCGSKLGTEEKNYVGLTRAGFSLVYTLR
ncbi:MAG TPA: DUF3575 domain-containing protein [Daejeonella sp.]